MLRDMILTAGQYLLNTESYLKFGRFLALEGNFPIYTSILILGITFLSPENSVQENGLNRKDKWKLFVICMLTLAAVWTSMYLVFTPQGRTAMITGVQGRYYAPVLIPLMICCRTDKFQWKVNEITYNKAFLGLEAFLTLYVIYFEMMKPYCF